MQYEARHYPAFPTLVSSFDLKGHPSEKTVIDMIDTWESAGQSSYITGDEMFLNDKRLVDLWKTIQECCDQYCNESGIDYTLISTSWFNTLYEKGTVTAHRHERSVISGAYYPKCDPGSAPLVFESPLQPYQMNMNNIRQTNYNAYNLDFVPQEGLLVLFPSWLRHSVPQNDAMKRYTISFNTIRRDDREHFQTIRDYRVEQHESSDPEPKV